MADTMNILVIDDEADMRDSITQWLNLSGFNSVSHDSAEAALGTIAADYAGIVISDIKMPGMDGMALLRKLQAVDSALPVILITGHGDVQLAVEAMRIGIPAAHARQPQFAAGIVRWGGVAAQTDGVERGGGELARGHT
jgi:FixJ family two-component response regulator